MSELLINGKKAKLIEGDKLLDVAERTGIEIPTLCYLKELGHFTSCMVCVVKDKKRGNLVPACSTPAADGMDIETDSLEVIEARRVSFELLLSEHTGDCESPCRISCPTRMDIPRMIRQISAGQLDEAIKTVKEHIALPAILGYICPAPCEKNCRRSRHDQAVSICSLKRFVAETDLEKEEPFIPECSSNGKKIAVAGSGPAGLSAAYYLASLGYSCTVIEKASQAGGMLRTCIKEKRLPGKVLDSEIGILKKMGVDFRMDTSIGKDILLDELKDNYDAVILATGSEDTADLPGIERGKNGITIEKKSMLTSLLNVFAAGAAVRPMKIAVRACADGRAAAYSVDAYLSGEKKSDEAFMFNSRIRNITDGEMDIFLKNSSMRSRVVSSGDTYSKEEAIEECLRCLNCDCLKKSACRLRAYSDQYTAKQTHYKGERTPFRQIGSSSGIVFEPGKCIKCGICVKITRDAGEQCGLSFKGRGFEVEVAVPFNEVLEKALLKTASKCIEHCPTSALVHGHKVDQ